MGKGNGLLLRFVLTVAGVSVGTAILGGVLRSEATGQAQGAGQGAAPAGAAQAQAPGGQGEGFSFVERRFDAGFAPRLDWEEDRDGDWDDDADEHWERERARRDISRFVRPPSPGQALPRIRSRRS